MACYLNSYKPLALTAVGRAASQRFNIPPFVDGSIRREPDLEHEYPAITCLCRADKFAPRLIEDDLVAYMTTKRRFGRSSAHRRLTAVLRVIEVVDSHADGAEWYRQRRLSLPNNCMIPGNRAKPLQRSHQHSPVLACGGESGCGLWDRRYRIRARRWGSFAICERLWAELSWDAPVIEDDDFIAAFDSVPGTRNPGALPQDEFNDFLQLMGVELS